MSVEGKNSSINSFISFQDSVSTQEWAAIREYSTERLTYNSQNNERNGKECQEKGVTTPKEQKVM